MPLTKEERALIDAQWPAIRAELGLPEPPVPPRRASNEAIAAVQRKHDAARAQRLVDEATLTRRKGQPVTLAPYDGELNDVQSLRLEEMQAANYKAEEAAIEAAATARLPLDAWDQRTREQVQTERKMLEQAFAAQALDAQADEMKARIVRDADGNPVSITQPVRMPDPR